MIKIQPAATVLIVKDDPSSGLQILLLKRNDSLKFAPGFWVFPGGRVDTEDGGFGETAILETAKVAAVRETQEEAGLTIAPHDLHHFCHWTTPKGTNRRFSTWFFSALVHADHPKVTIDQSEIVDHLWMHPKDALVDHFTGKLHMLPPTFFTLQRIKDAKDYDEVLSEFSRTGIIKAEPVTVMNDGLMYLMYKGDAGYETRDLSKTDTLHRLSIDMKKATYDFQHTSSEFPPITGGVDLLLP